MTKSHNIYYPLERKPAQLERAILLDMVLKMFQNLIQQAASSFAQTYRQARKSFLAQAMSLGLEVESSIYDKRGPEGEELALDCLWLGPENATKVLVLMSATHGVEGFCGSACQIDALSIFPASDLPEGVAVLYAHALNPYGFAWLRRVDDEGIDLNRNFVDFSKELPVNEGYDRLAIALLSSSDRNEELYVYQQEYGLDALVQAIVGGQYQHPQGLFYGGAAPSWSRKQVEAMIKHYGLTERQQVCVIDYHTGLGPFGYGEPICDLPPQSVGAKWCQQHFGPSVTLPVLGTSSSTANVGLSDMGWHELVGEHLAFIALEFGTFEREQLLEVLRADHCLHAQGEINWQDAETQKVKHRLKHFFYPDTQDWREMVLFRSRQVIAQALKGLAAS